MQKKFYDIKPELWLFQTKDKPGLPGDKEEDVRQWAIYELLSTYGISINDISVEQEVKFGHRTLRADIAVCDQNKPVIIVECKRRQHTDHAGALKQARSYADSIGSCVHYAVYTNGIEWQVNRKWEDKWICCGSDLIGHCCLA